MQFNATLSSSETVMDTQSMSLDNICVIPVCDSLYLPAISLVQDHALTKASATIVAGCVRTGPASGTDVNAHCVQWTSGSSSAHLNCSEHPCIGFQERPQQRCS